MPCQALRLQSRRAGSSLIGGSFDRTCMICTVLVHTQENWD